MRDRFHCGLSNSDLTGQAWDWLATAGRIRRHNDRHRAGHRSCATGGYACTRRQSAETTTDETLTGANGTACETIGQRSGNHVEQPNAKKSGDADPGAQTAENPFFHALLNITAIMLSLIFGNFERFGRLTVP